MCTSSLLRLVKRPFKLLKLENNDLRGRKNVFKSQYLDGFDDADDFFHAELETLCAQFIIITIPV